MRTRHVALVLIALTLCGCAARGPADSREGWTSLFDGRTLTGWTQRGGKAAYFVEDGCIIGATRPNTANSFLCTDTTHADFELELDFKIDPKANSGIQIRSESRADYKNSVVHGYQVEIDPSDRAWTGGLYDESRRGWLAPLDKNEPARKAFRQNEWNHFRILAIGDHFQTWLNGVPATDLHDSMTPDGFIALQVHSTGASTDELRVMWKNLRLKRR